MRQRKSTRLKNYNYASPGYYFVTVCTQNRAHLFGDIIGGRMIINDIGAMTEDWWIKMPIKFTNVDLDEYQIMPNHFHGILIINYNVGSAHGGGVGAGLVPARDRAMPAPDRATTRVAPTPILGNIIGAFKSLTTHEYIVGVKKYGWEPFNKRLWQRNYYERVIRNENELHKIRRYIIENPIKWPEDVNNIVN